MTIRMKSSRPHKMSPEYFLPKGTVGTVLRKTKASGAYTGEKKTMYVVDGWPLPVSETFVEVLNGAYDER